MSGATASSSGFHWISPSAGTNAPVFQSGISNVVQPPIESMNNLRPKLLVLGVANNGAKTRVETQVKITLVLTLPKPGAIASAEECINEFGLPNSEIDSNLDRVGTWSHIRLPPYSALKKRNKKFVLKEPLPPQQCLYLSSTVIKGSSPNEEVFICVNCRNREQKRMDRNKETRVRPVLDLDEKEDEETERKKVVLFNCGEYVEFGEGEVTLPTRITCYCKHHKEKKGFW
jgi:hypothetical protein